MKYSLEPVFVLFPLICLFIHMTNMRTKRRVHFVLMLIFILLYSFSLNGSDIDGYRWHYEFVESGGSALSNAQEIGYYYLMDLSATLGMSYIWFRVCLLSFLSAVLLVTVRKYTDDLPLALYFISSMFVIYTISAYRQYIVMVFSILWLYEYCCGKKKLAIIGTGILLLFHVSAILPLACMVFEFYNTNTRIERTTGHFKRNFILFIGMALSLRVLTFFWLKVSFVNTIMGKILSIHASPNPTILTFGFFSRLVFLLIITYMYRMSNTEDNKIKLLYWYYSISMIAYIIVPLEFVMGRLMNNAHILSAVLIPMIRKDVFLSKRDETYSLRSRTTVQMTFLLEVLAFVILINQLLSQNGYTPYLNVLLGDEIISFPIIK